MDTANTSCLRQNERGFYAMTIESYGYHVRTLIRWMFAKGCSSFDICDTWSYVQGLLYAGQTTPTGGYEAVIIPGSHVQGMTLLQMRRSFLAQGYLEPNPDIGCYIACQLSGHEMEAIGLNTLLIMHTPNDFGGGCLPMQLLLDFQIYEKGEYFERACLFNYSVRHVDDRAFQAWKDRFPNLQPNKDDPTHAKRGYDVPPLDEDPTRLKCGYVFLKPKQ